MFDNFSLETIIIICINVFAFLLYGIDKLRAKNKAWRIPESTLLILPVFQGGAGAILGMVVFNHKTSKMLFRILVPLICIANYYTYSYFIFYLGKLIH